MCRNVLDSVNSVTRFLEYFDLKDHCPCNFSVECKKVEIRKRKLSKKGEYFFQGNINKLFSDMYRNSCLSNKQICKCKHIFNLTSKDIRIEVQNVLVSTRGVFLDMGEGPKIVGFGTPIAILGGRVEFLGETFLCYNLQSNFHVNAKKIQTHGHFHRKSAFMKQIITKL